MEKLDGSYTLVEVQDGTGLVARPPVFSGDLFLFSADGYTFTMSIKTQGVLVPFVGTWSADKTHLTLGGDRFPYTWDGTHLAFSIPDPGGGPETMGLKWQQTVAF